MSNEQKIFDPIGNLDDMRRMNIQASMGPGASVEEGLRQWTELTPEQQPAVRAAWDAVQDEFKNATGAYVPTND